MKLPTIIDSHCHFWDPNQFSYDWNHGLPSLDRAFVPADLASATSEPRLGKILFVECGCADTQSLAEVDWVTSLGHYEKRLNGIVARAPVEKGGAVRLDLDQLAKRPLVKGVR